MNSYYNWGELLAVAPSAVSGLEKLIVMSYQPRMDFRLNTESLSSGSYEFIKYLKNFQTTLLQLGHQGYWAQNSHEYRHDPNVLFKSIQPHQGNHPGSDVSK
jgi:hypothetical protein